LIFVSGHWVDVGMRISWEPDSGTGKSIRDMLKKEFIDGPRWMWLKGRGEILELPCMYGVGY
jgi:hypothetical protein